MPLEVGKLAILKDLGCSKDLLCVTLVLGLGDSG